LTGSCRARQALINLTIYRADGFARESTRTFRLGRASTSRSRSGSYVAASPRALRGRLLRRRWALVEQRENLVVDCVDVAAEVIEDMGCVGGGEREQGF